MSENLAELKYQETVSHAAVHTAVTGSVSPQIGCLLTAVVMSLVMGCCALVFMPGPKS
ncbi:MAG: hypothetical protein ACFB2W_19005 [Leptolyngbyaceae cyanobacterium]